MRINVPRFVVVHISQRSERQPFATAEFLADASLHIFNQVVREILALPERHLQHEFPLRSWLKPKLRKAQRSNSSGVNKIDYSSTIHAIAGETIRVPCQNTKRLFTRFNHRKHFGKFVSPGLLCAFRFRELTDNLNTFSLRKFSQFKKLCLNGHYLLVILLCALSSVENALRFWFELFHIVIGANSGILRRKQRRILLCEASRAPRARRAEQSIPTKLVLVL
ncbi:MAG: hypothetical protein WC131_01490 [Bacilli bacterium]